MKVIIDLVEMNDPSKLEKKSLPYGIEVSSGERELSNISTFRKLVNDFNKGGDELINEIFTPLIPKNITRIPVIAIAGIPGPYDAWCGYYNGLYSSFFNLDICSLSYLETAGANVLKHELTHVLLHDLLPIPSESDYLGILNYLLINEGIAHFIGFPGDRSKLLTDYVNHWEVAEEKFLEACKKLEGEKVSEEVASKIICDANQGSFWNKYASIAGMFRVAHAYEKFGSQRVVSFIKNNELPRYI